MIALAECIPSDITNPFTEVVYTKQELGMFVVGFDILSVLSVILFTWILIETQEDYVDRFNNQTI